MPVSPDELVKANARFIDDFQYAGLSKDPAQKVAIVTCMDARIDPLACLGLNVGDALVLRNAGGRISDDAIRSLFICQQMLSADVIVVMHHTDCGMLGITNEKIRDDVRLKEKGQLLRKGAHKKAKRVDFLGFSEPAASVRVDVAMVKDSPLLRRTTQVYGMIYDVGTGVIRLVE